MAAAESAMHQALFLGIAALLGAALGLAYFGWLWASLKALPRQDSPRAAFALGWLGRNVLALAGMWTALQMGAPHLALAMTGFLAARQCLLRRLGLAAPGRPSS